MSTAFASYSSARDFAFRAYRKGTSDPRYVVATILFAYLALGLTVLGFNRSPEQILITSVSAVLMELGFAKLFRKKKGFPLSALITSFGLSILLNYSHDPFFPLLPVFLAIGSKYVFTLNGRHVFNPAMFGVASSLLISQELITAAPAYQWNGVGSMAFFVIVPAVMLFIPRIDRTRLVVSFLITYTILTALRALIMRHHLPFETLFWGTLSSPSFLLFVFFMITDPATSPAAKKEQTQVGISLAIVDLLFHIRKSYYTFFFAALTVGSARFLWKHYRQSKTEGRGLFRYAASRFVSDRYWIQPLTILALGFLSAFAYGAFIRPNTRIANLEWTFTPVSKTESGIHPRIGDVFSRVDPRIQHIVKWPLSVGDSVSAGDYDGDGLPDLFFTFPLKSDADRNSLYRNEGGFRFTRVPLPMLDERSRNIEKYGLPTNAAFVDVDGDGDKDLFISYAFGSPVYLENRLVPTGKAVFVDSTEKIGLKDTTISIASTFFDFDGDGRLDLFITNVLPADLPGYATPHPLNFFHLPQPEYAGDRRMFNFMHQSWNNARNGGENWLYLQGKDGTFTKLDSKAIGIPETGWSLAVGAADLNRDGRPDLYVANDFGPDDYYLNEGGKHFRRISGTIFGSVGRDTYKGMNASIQDIDRNGWLDVYVSNVHHDLQAEGSLLWMFSAPEKGADPFLPRLKDEATRLGALNERRFGWGASLSDFNNDGWIDIAQANGMVDDTLDHRFEKCPDYWYVNEKIARSPPSIHSYADQWGDIRGMCIHGKERNRLYLNQGNGSNPQFVDVADAVGMTELTNSRGMAAVDLDRDGRLDLVVSHMFTEPTIYRNRLKDPARPGIGDHPLSPHWLSLELESNAPDCNRSGVGSQVVVRDALGQQMKEVQVVDGLNAQNEMRLHFGMGAQASPTSVEVNWCGRKRERFDRVSIDRFTLLKMGTGTAI